MSRIGPGRTLYGERATSKPTTAGGPAVVRPPLPVVL